MADQDRSTQDQGLSDAELQDQEINQLPDREAMSLIDANVAAPVNLAAALNVLSDGSVAYANAEQTVDIDQSTG
ncbi:MAG TPA: hypothetical protein VFH60_07560 [Chloroflexia bacterium]|nr:hypothetical protein [Chloroflexia bacterium]